MQSTAFPATAGPEYGLWPLPETAQAPHTGQQDILLEEPQEPAAQRAKPRSTAFVRRAGAPSAFTSSVQFDGHPGVGGTLHFRSHYPMGSYEVVDHLGAAVGPGPVEGGLAAVEVLATHYGLPLPVQVIPRGALGARQGTARTWG